DHRLVQAMGGQLGADPQWAVSGRRPRARQAGGEAGVVLPTLGGHPLDGCLGLVPGDAAYRQFVGQVLARMLASHQQAQRPLGRRRLRPAPATASLAGRCARDPRATVAIRGRHLPAQALASSSSAFSATTGASFSRNAASILAATSGLSLRYWRAFSLPWPMRSPSQLYQAPDFSTSLASTPMSMSSPSRLMPSPYRISVTICLNGGAILFLTTLILVWLPMISSPFL